MKGRLEGDNLGWHVLLDRDAKVADLFGGRRTPHTFVLDDKSVLRYAGAVDSDAAGTEGAEKRANWLQDALDGRRGRPRRRRPPDRPQGLNDQAAPVGRLRGRRPRYSRIAAMQAVMKHARLPATIAGRPHRASVSRCSGTMAPMPPTWIAMLAKLLKPQSA